MSEAQVEPTSVLSDSIDREYNQLLVNKSEPREGCNAARDTSFRIEIAFLCSGAGRVARLRGLSKDLRLPGTSAG